MTDPASAAPDDTQPSCGHHASVDTVAAITVFSLDLAAILTASLPLMVVTTSGGRRQRSVGLLDELIVTGSMVIIMAAILPAPLNIISFLQGWWWGGRVSCAVRQVVRVWKQLSMHWLLAAMACDRWLVAAARADLLHRDTLPRYQKKWLTEVCLLLCVPLLVSCLPLTGVTPLSVPSLPPGEPRPAVCPDWLLPPPPHLASCVVWSETQHHNTVFPLVYVGLCLLGLLLATGAISAEIFTRRQVPPTWRHLGGTTLPPGVTQHSQIGVHQSKIVIAVCTSYWLLSTTTLAVLATCWLLPRHETPQGLVSSATWLHDVVTHIMYLLQPVIYCWCSPRYRRGYRGQGGACFVAICGCPELQEIAEQQQEEGERQQHQEQDECPRQQTTTAEQQQQAGGEARRGQQHPQVSAHVAGGRFRKHERRKSKQGSWRQGKQSCCERSAAETARLLENVDHQESGEVTVCSPTSSSTAARHFVAAESFL